MAPDVISIDYYPNSVVRKPPWQSSKSTIGYQRDMDSYTARLYSRAPLQSVVMRDFTPAQRHRCRKHPAPECIGRFTALCVRAWGAIVFIAPFTATEWRGRKRAKRRVGSTRMRMRRRDARKYIQRLQVEHATSDS